jgi:hypothetical protein
VRRYNPLGGYGFYICGNGEWQIAQYHTGTKPALLDHNVIAVDAAQEYVLSATCNGSSVSLALDGVSVGSKTDLPDTTTTYTIALAVGSYNGGNDGAAAFKDFGFAPLPSSQSSS